MLVSRNISFIFLVWIVRLAGLNIVRKLNFFMIVVVCWIDQFKIWYYALYHDASLATMISREHLHDIVALWQVIAICQRLLLFHWRYNYPSYALLLHGRAILKLSVSVIVAVTEIPPPSAQISSQPAGIALIVLVVLFSISTIVLAVLYIIKLRQR